MISGDLIRLKNLVDDCVRIFKSVQRESERLTPDELEQLTQYLRTAAPQFGNILQKSEPVEKTGTSGLQVVSR